MSATKLGAKRILKLTLSTLFKKEKKPKLIKAPREEDKKLRTHSTGPEQKKKE
jgi:hypothetical protein